MHVFRRLVLLLPPVLFAGLLRCASAQPTVEASFENPEAVVEALYDYVSFEAGGRPAVEQVAPLFLREAVLVLFTSRTGVSVLSPEDFVQRFVEDINRFNVIRTGYVKKILSKKIDLYGNIAHALVVYDADVPGDDKPGSRGMDSIELVLLNNRWFIVSLTNTLPGPGNPLPEF